MQDRLTNKELKAYREALLSQQSGVDPIAQVGIKVPCLDHDHKTGRVRAVLDRRTNSWEGKVRNAFVRTGMHKLGADYADCLRRLSEYVSKDYAANKIHPLFKTADEKRLAKNKRIRLRNRRKKGKK